MSVPLRWRRSRSADLASLLSPGSDQRPDGHSRTSTGEAGDMEVSRLLKRSRLVVAALAAIALVLGGLIYRDVFVGTKNTASSLNLYTVGRRTGTSSVTRTGNLVPMQQANVSFKGTATLTEVGVRV